MASKALRNKVLTAETKYEAGTLPKAEFGDILKVVINKVGSTKGKSESLMAAKDLAKKASAELAAGRVADAARYLARGNAGVGIAGVPKAQGTVRRRRRGGTRRRA